MCYNENIINVSECKFYGRTAVREQRKEKLWMKTQGEDRSDGLVFNGYLTKHFIFVPMQIDTEQERK